MIRFGLCLCIQSPPDGADIQQRWQESLDEAYDAEAWGFDMAVFTEHHQQPDGYFPNPLLSAAAAAAKTRRILVGSSLSLLPIHHPIEFAENVCQLDVMSNGRAFIGVGLGYAAQDFSIYNINPRLKPSLYEDALQILTQALASPTVDFVGKRHNTGGPVQIYPRPIQQPFPIYGGAWSEPGIIRAARMTDGWITDVINTTQNLKAWAELYRNTCAEVNKTPHIITMREGFCAKTKEKAEETYAPWILETHRLYYSFGGYNPAIEPWMADVPDASHLTLDHIKEDRFIIGSPDDCIEKIEHIISELNIDGLILRMRQPSGPSYMKTLNSIALFGEHVIPYFRRKHRQQQEQRAKEEAAASAAAAAAAQASESAEASESSSESPPASDADNSEKQS